MYIDFKITTWERAKIHGKEDEELVLEALKKNEIKTEGDIANLGLEVVEYETLTDVSEYMTAEENNGFATIEVYDNKDKVIFANGKH